MNIFKKLAKPLRRPRVGEIYGEYTIVLVGYRGKKRVYICKSDAEGGNVFLKTEDELREEQA